MSINMCRKLNWISVLFLLAGLVGSVHGQDASGRSAAVGNWQSPRVHWQPVTPRAVKLSGFLGTHVDANDRLSLLDGLSSPIPSAFDALAEGRTPPDACRRLATDSDFFKWLEGACYALIRDASLTELAGAVERYADILVRMQEPDGFLGTRISPAAPFDSKVNHDLYCAGHFIEAAVAHQAATGRDNLLNAAVKLADFYLNAWQEKHPYFETVGTREHPEIELALVRLYRATGRQRFLEFADAIARMGIIQPRLDETRAGGGSLHAVRLCYLLSGVAELYIETGKDDLFRNTLQLWDEIITTRMYVTGGIGYNERVPAVPYDLPQTLLDHPSRDIAETCASVSLMMLSWRLHAITGDPRCFDTIETVLYNHYLGAISQDHRAIFYYNPLRRTGDLTGKTDHSSDPVRRCRLPHIHSTACCMPNAWRFYAQLPEYLFSTHGDEIRINLYSGADTSFRLTDGSEVRLSMRTDYPHDGKVLVTADCDSETAAYTISMRVPGWCGKVTQKLNDGSANELTPGRYHSVSLKGNRRNTLVLDMPMKPEVLTSHPAVSANAGQVAFRRGPLVYCLERQDAAGMDLDRVRVQLNPEAPAGSIREQFDPQMGMHLLRVSATQASPPDKSRSGLYAQLDTAEGEPAEISLIPFYFRANRADDTRWITWITCTAD